MKTAVSIPNELLESSDGLARRLGMTRGEHRGEGITDRLDKVYGVEEEEKVGLDSILPRLRQNSLAEDEW